MKKLLLLSILGIFFLGINAQNIELSGMYGYQFGSKIDYYGGYIKLKDSDGYHASLGYNTGANAIIQINYYRNSADVRFRDIVLSPNETKIATANLDWFSIGGARTIGSETAYAFVGGGLGLLFSNTENINRDVVKSNIGGNTNFYFEFKFGGTFMFNDRIGFRGQAILQCPIDYAGVYFGYGTGGPSSGVSLNSTVAVFSLQGGLVITIPQ